MNYKKIVIIFFLFFVFSDSFAQREANIWYFGTYAGVNFNTGAAIPVTDGRINRWEGVASFCNRYGELILYTDGDSVWNASHQPMDNGFDLNGHPSSTESAIIIPYPEHDSLYFIFTVDAEGGDYGLCYSLVNINYNNGLGAITEKNHQLVTPVSEKVTAIRHKNNTDFWVITHGWETDSFFVYIVTPDGVDTIPQIFEIGATHADIGLHGNNAVGYMRVSPDGSRIASAIQVSMIFELFDFNNETGEITNPITIPAPGSPYGVEFSPDATKLYMTSMFSLYQADITSDNPDDIINSIVEIGTSPTSNFFGAVQLATDGKLYLAHEYSDYLGVVNNPTESGIDCNFELNGLYLLGRQSRMGLPDFIQTYFLPPDFQYINYCYGDSTLFFLQDTVGIDSVFWDFGDPLSAENTSQDFYPKHLYLLPGLYDVNIVIWRNGVDYDKHRIIQINPLPEVELGADTLICSGDSLLLDAYNLNCSYSWNNSSIDSVIWINEAGFYSVEVVNNYTFCFNSDSIIISTSPIPEFNIGTDTGFCSYDSVLVSVEYENAHFLWNTGDTTNSIIVKQSGTYILQITDSLSCKNADTISISEYLLPVFDLGNDTILCPETQISLNPNIEGHYLWSDSTTNNYYVVNNEGQYWLKIIDSNFCEFSDTINVESVDFPDVYLGNDTLLCEDEIIILYANPINCEYLWSDGSTANFIEVSQTGTYILYSTNICGTDADAVYVEFEYCGEVDIPNIFTPNNDGLNEIFYIKGIKYDVWQLLIYNRWGQLVYQSDHYKNDWNGDNLPDGTYYYIFQNQEKKKIMSGHVDIYRSDL